MIELLKREYRDARRLWMDSDENIEAEPSMRHLLLVFAKNLHELVSPIYWIWAICFVLSVGAYIWDK